MVRLLLVVGRVFLILDWEALDLLLPFCVPLLSIESILEVDDGVLGTGCASQLGAVGARLDRMEGLQERPQVRAIGLVDGLGVLIVRLHADVAFLHP